MNLKKSINRMRCQKGNTTVEIALILSLVVLPLLTGVVDFSTYINLRHSISRAAMQGSLAASRGEDASAKVETYLQTAGLDPSKASISVSFQDDQATFGKENTVTITYNTPDSILLDYIPGMDSVQASATTKDM